MTDTRLATLDIGRMDLAPTAAARLVESIVAHGDISGLGPAERAQYYIAQCARLGLDAHTQPFAFLKFQGKEVLYPTRGATDQLARIHAVSREIIDGPKLMDLGGIKCLFAVCRATYKGRTETAVATLPASDPIMGLMKVETKAKRRATLSILGLGMLDEMEVESLPATEITRTPNPQLAPPTPFEQMSAAADLRDVADCYRTHRASVDREALATAAVARLEALGTKNAKNALAAAVRSDDAAAFFEQTHPESQARTFAAAVQECVATIEDAATIYREMNNRLQAEGPDVLTHARALLHDRLTQAGVQISPSDLQKHLAAGLTNKKPAPEWASNAEAIRAHVATYSHANAVVNACVKRGRDGDLGAGRALATFTDAASKRLVALSAGELTETDAQAMVAQAIAKGRDATTSKPKNGPKPEGNTP